MRSTNSLHSVFLRATLVAVPALMGVLGGGCGGVVSGAGGGGGASPAGCPAEACGPVSDLAKVCSDGSTLVQQCERVGDTCTWVFPDCPAPQTCDSAKCGPSLGMPSYVCSDGSTGGPTGRCLADATGACSWEVHQCPVPASDGGTPAIDAGPAPPACKVDANCPSGEVCAYAIADGCAAAGQCVNSVAGPMCLVYAPGCTCDGKEVAVACNNLPSGMASAPIVHSGRCGASCTYNGQTYTDGVSFTASDGCNTCSCQSGSVACTKLACPACDPSTEYNRQYHSSTPTQCIAMDFACLGNTQAFSNSCGCGCQQPSTCPAYFNCMPGPGTTACDVASLNKTCPFSKIAY